MGSVLVFLSQPRRYILRLGMDHDERLRLYCFVEAFFFLFASCGKLYISLRIEFDTSNGLQMKWEAKFENSCTLELK
jgi:hypothetical protein